MSPLSLAMSSARHPRVVIAAWAIAFIASIGLSVLLWGQGLTAERVLLVEAESNVADKLLEERFRGPRRVTEIVVVRSDTYTVVDPQFEATVQNLFFDIAALGPDVVAGVSQYYHSGSDYQVSESGHSTVMSVTMSGTLDEARVNVSSVIDVARRHGGQDDFTVLVVGEASIADRVSDLAYLVLQWPFALVFILIPGLVFQLARASRLPIVVGLVSVAIPVGASALIGLVFPLSLFSYTVIMVTGLSLGMSGVHLIASRYREERARGLSKPDSIETTGATAARVVLLGGLAAIVALASMAIVPASIFTSIAVGAIMATLVPLLAFVTLTPALLVLSNDWFSGLRLPSADESGTPPKRRVDLQRLSNRVTEAALSRPVFSVAIAAVALLALATFALRLNLGLTGVDLFPESQTRGAYAPQVKRAYTMLAEDFPAGIISPVEIVIDAPFKDPDIEPRVAELQAALATDPDFAGESRIQNNQDHDMVLITVPTRDLPESESARAAVQRLRNVYVPELFAGTGVDVLVTGGPALAADYVDVTQRYAPYVVAVVLVSSVLALLVASRSVVITVITILARLLTFGAAGGVVVVALQWGVGAGSGLLGYHHTPTIEMWGLLLSFSLLFGVSTVLDMHVMGRVRELHVQTGDNDEAVAFGLRSTAWASTVASLVMAAVFFMLALGDLPVFHQVGFALTAAMLIDALVVRLILLPSAMKLLGAASWYFPGRSLQR